MHKKITVQFYEGKRVGLYKYGAKPTDKPLDVTMSDVWAQLYNWRNNVSNFANTSTYGKLERNNLYRTFCLSIIKIEPFNEYLITTWNEVPSTKSGVPFIDSTTSVGGNITIGSTPLKKGAIPGYPSYFWVIPDKNSIASLKVQGSYNLIGTQNLNFYMKSFIEKFSAPVNVTRDNKGDVHVYYDIAGNRENCTAKFDLILKRESADIQALTRKYSSVRKIIKKATISTEMSQLDNGNFFHRSARKLTAVLTGSELFPANDVTSWHFDFNFTPRTEQEFENIINQYLREVDDNDNVDLNLGVEFKGRAGRTVWLAENILKVADIDCKPEYLSGKELILSDEWLVGFINRQRDTLIKKLA